MIKVSVFRNVNGEVYGFSVNDHGESIVCAAVSALTLNAVNCIENFSDRDFECEYEQDGGYLFLEVPFIKNGGHDHDINLILNCLVLGLKGIKLDYDNDINIIDKEV